MTMFDDGDDFQTIEGGIELAPRVRVPAGALRTQFSRSGGPGGQNVNKVNTKAELWIALADLAPHLTHRALARLEAAAGRRLTKDRELHFASEIHRSQERNRLENLERLRELLVAAMVEPKVRRKSKPSRAAKQRRLDQKKHRGKIKARRQGRE
jgi:ribosome-associated protein